MAAAVGHGKVHSIPTLDIAGGGGGESLRADVLRVLCYGRPLLKELNSTPANVHSAGLFSQLNFVAQVVLESLLRGERPASVEVLFSRTRLLGYGDGPLGMYFERYACPPAAQLTLHRSVESALLSLRDSDRYHLTSHLMHTLYRPLMPPRSQPPSPGTYDVAVHVRRGDKLLEKVREEQTHVWGERELATHVRHFAGAPRAKRTAAEAGAMAGGRMDAVGVTRAHAELKPPPKKILVASDDNGFAFGLSTRLRRMGYAVSRISNEHESVDAAGRSGGTDWKRCGPECVPPLLELAWQFAAAKFMMVGSRSNLGTFLLSWWAAPNGDARANFADLDNRVWAPQMYRNGKYFCSLHWGSRRGICRSNETMSVFMRRAARRAALRKAKMASQIEAAPPAVGWHGVP